MNKIKKYIDDNVSIRVTDFQLLDVSFYGCDARFEFEIRDKETSVVLDTDMETVGSAFMGVDDSEEIYYFLENKGIDFSEEYDDDFDKLPDELKKEFEAHELETYNDMYHEWFFEDEDDEHTEIIEKIRNEMYMPNGLFYVVKDGEAHWIKAEADYFGVHLSSETLKIHRVYNVDAEDWIYALEGVFFDIVSDFGCPPDFSIEFYERNDQHPYTVTSDDLQNDRFTGYIGKAGDTIYEYGMSN